MIKALLLIFDPIATWDRIFQARRSLVFILLAYLLPMVLLSTLCEAYGLVHWGKVRGELGGDPKPFKMGETVVIEAAQFILSIGVIFIGANLVKALGETFHGRHTFTQAFATVAYGLSPLFLVHTLDALPSINPWVSWSIGILLSMSVLYQGVPRMMVPDPPHAFGLYIMSALLLALISGLVRFVTAMYLVGKFSKLQVIVSDLAGKLPF